LICIYLALIKPGTSIISNSASLVAFRAIEASSLMVIPSPLRGVYVIYPDKKFLPLKVGKFIDILKKT